MTRREALILNLSRTHPSVKLQPPYPDLTTGTSYRLILRRDSIKTIWTSNHFRTTFKTSQAASLETMSGCQLLPATPPKTQSQLLPATPPKTESQLLPATPPETQKQGWTIAEPGDRQEVAVGGSGYTCTGAVDESSVGWNTEGRNSAATTNVLSTELM